MLVRIVEFIKNFFTTSIADSDKMEFAISIYRINIVRAKITAITIVILEAMMLLIHYKINRENLFNAPYIYYGAMYILMLVVMIAFFGIFTKLGADVARHISSVRFTGIVFIGFILMWCAGISLLDQLSSGQVIVYIVAVISIAITPFFEPVILFSVYLVVHLLFLIAMPYFQEAKQLYFDSGFRNPIFLINIR